MGFGAGGATGGTFGGQQQGFLPGGQQQGGSSLSQTPDFSMGLQLDPAMVNQFLQGLAESLKSTAASSTYASGSEAFEDFSNKNQTGGFYG